MDLDRTIVAVSSGLAPAERAVVRLSGNDTRRILLSIVQGRAADALRAAQSASHVNCPVAIGLGNRVIDAELMYWPDARSFTGEPSAEIHLLGSLPIVESLVEHLVSLGASFADRGEFTLRSFLSGKLDLTQAEAVLGVIEAQTDSELQIALGQLAGNLSKPVGELKSEIVELTAHVEAGLDFVEEDIEFISSDELAQALRNIADRLNHIHRELESRGVRARIPQVVLAGLPNAGKSSLFNALLGNERTIVSEQAGTTRDTVTGETTFDGQAAELVDTAGWEELVGDDPRAQAQSQLIQRLQQADLVLLCVAANDDSGAENAPESLRLESALQSTVAEACLRVTTKADLLESVGNQLSGNASVSVFDEISISRLRTDIASRLADCRLRHTEGMHATMIRCREAIGLAQQAVDQAREFVESAMGDELVASELRLAIDQLAAIIGEVHTEDLLGQIFSRFCIGK